MTGNRGGATFASYRKAAVPVPTPINESLCGARRKSIGLWMTFRYIRRVIHRSLDSGHRSITLMDSDIAIQ